MGERIRAHDWAATPLGLPGGWPQPLKTLVAVMLGANQPMFIAWGAEQTLLYNDAYAEVLALKHPGALGRPFLDVWDEIRSDLLPIVEQGFAGEPVHMDHIELVMHRRGYPEETHFSFSYTPVRDESGQVAGIFCPCTEITGQVLAERRRREAEVALRLERDRARGVLDGMAEGFGLLDRDFRVIDINAEGLRLEQRPREAILGKTHWEAWPGSEDSELGRMLKRAMAERVPLTLEHRYLWPDGHDAFLELRVYPTADGLALFWRNVTERHRHQEALRVERDRSVEILESISDAFYAVDRDWRFTYVNRKTAELWGRNADALIGKGYWDEFPQAVGSEAYHAHQRAMREGVPVQLETVSPIVGHWIGLSIHPTSGGGLSVYFRDISEKRQAEERLRESEERFRLMADAVPQIVWITDPSARVEFFNRQWSAYTGEAYVPETAAEVAAGFVHPEDGPPTMAAFDEARRTGGPFQVEHRIRSRTGEYRWFLVRGEPYRDPRTGEIVRWFGASIDIHDRRQAEAALREREARLSFMSGLDEAMRVSRDAPTAMAAATALLARHLGASRCAYADVDADNDRFVIRSDYTAPGIASSIGTYSLNLFGARASADMRGGRTLVVCDVPEELGPGEGREMFLSIGIGAIVCCPLVKNGRLIAMMAVHQDAPRRWREEEIKLVETVVERCWAQVERVGAEARLRESEEFNRRILESSSDCIKVLDTSARLQFMSPGALRIMEVDDFGTIEGCDWREFWSGPDRDRAREAVRIALEGGNARFQGQTPTLKGRPKWWDVAVTPINGPNGEVEKLLSVSRDITDTKQAEEHQRLLINELNHRVKNTLATVQSIATQTLRNSRSPEEARSAMEARLMALSKAHDVLTRQNWESANLREIVAQALAPYTHARENRLHLQGPDIRLQPRTALALAMALQELATNAVKYGSLSNETGEVRIEWSLDASHTPPCLSLTWRESGGPPVEEPSRRGFGTRLIERSLAQDLDGEVAIEFAPEGVVCRVVAPIVTDDKAA